MILKELRLRTNPPFRILKPISYFILMKKIFLYTLLCLIAYSLKAQPPTWSEDISCIIYNNCSKCHNQKGIAPFSLMRYEDAKSRASAIKYFVEERIMPPWPPDPEYNEMTDQRFLTDEEVALIKDWVDAGAPRGDEQNEPAPPIIETAEFIAQPDMVVTLPEYTSRAVAGDEYRCFVIKNENNTDKFITQIEVVPSNRNIVHHVLVFHDESNTPVTLDASDPSPGYLCFGGIGSFSAELIGGWVPGQTAVYLPDGMGIPLPANTNIVVQLHYPHGSAGQKDQTKINFKLSDNPNLRSVSIDPFLNHVISITEPLFIPANTVKSFREEFRLPIKATLIGAAPHMHLIGRSIKTYAVTPTNDTIQIIDIPNWNFEWQGFYQLKKAIVIPAQSLLVAEAVYDNTPNNPFNPNNPPKDVSVGEATTDEMMLVYMNWLFYRPGDENLVFTDNPAIGSDDCGDLSSNDNSIDLSPFVDIYPNPLGNQVLNIRIKDIDPGQQSTIKITDLRGKVVYKNMRNVAPNSIFNLDFPAESGVYFLVIYNAENIPIVRKKLIKS